MLANGGVADVKHVCLVVVVGENSNNRVGRKDSRRFSGSFLELSPDNIFYREA
ncbi:MAG: hypothetical protein JJU28_18355 [Cyclobacteriaceae bacterium]|nr:hypothetical protein [Cyclobacteriaceae bacterium]